jgi:hypothetical protein
MGRKQISPGKGGGFRREPLKGANNTMYRLKAADLDPFSRWEKVARSAG